MLSHVTGPAAILPVFITLLQLSTPLSAQVPLQGRVFSDVTGQPVSGALVEVEILRVSTRTGPDGRFILAGVPVGSVVVRVQAIGFVPMERVVRGSGFQTVRLVPSPLRLPPIEVFRDRTEMTRMRDGTPGSAHVVDRATVRDQGTAFHDVHGVLRAVPGVVVQEEEGFGLRPNIGMRGTGSERSAKITLMEDGVLIAPAPYAAPSAYYFPVTGRMQSVEVRKGSSQIKYGPRTIGGAINLVSSYIPSRLSAEAEVAGGAHSTRRLAGRVGATEGNVGWLVEAYRVDTDGYKDVDGGTAAGFRLDNYVGKLRIQTDAGARVFQALEFKVGLYDQRSDETYLGVTHDDFRATPFRRYAASQQDVMNADHQQYQVRHFLRPSHRVDVTTTAYRNNFARNWYKLQSVLGVGISRVLDDPTGHAPEFAVLRGATSGPDALRLRANNRSYYGQGVQTVVAASVPTGSVTHQFEMGARYHEDAEDRLQHEDAFQMLSGSMVETTAGAPGSQSNRVSRANAWSGFAQHHVRLGRFTVAPGVRVERIRLTRDDYATDAPRRTTPLRTRATSITGWTWGLGTTVRLTETTRLVGGIHRGFAPPGPGANTDTDAERSTSYELGARVNADRAWLEIMLFYNDYDNVLGTATLSTGGDGSGDQFNGGAVRALGVEVSARGRPEVGSFSVPLTLTVTRSEATFRTAFTSAYGPWGTVVIGDKLPYQPEWQLGASVGLEAPTGWRLGLSGHYASAMRTVAGQGSPTTNRRTDASLAINTVVEYPLTPGARAFVSVQNLLDRRSVVARRPAGLRPSLPRTIMAGMRLTN